VLQRSWNKKNKRAKSAVKIAYICRDPGATARRHQCLNFSRVLISSPPDTEDQNWQKILDVTGKKERRNPSHWSGYALLGQTEPRQLPDFPAWC